MLYSQYVLWLVTWLYNRTVQSVLSTNTTQLAGWHSGAVEPLPTRNSKSRTETGSFYLPAIAGWSVECNIGAWTTVTFYRLVSHHSPPSTTSTALAWSNYEKEKVSSHPVKRRQDVSSEVVRPTDMLDISPPDWTMPGRSVCCRILHFNPESSLRGPVQIQQVPHGCPPEDGAGWSSVQARWRKLQCEIQNRTFR